MGRKAKITVDEAVDVVKTFISHFTTNDFPAYTSAVWKEMSEQTHGKYSAHNFYIGVRENRFGMLTKARAELGIGISGDVKCENAEIQYSNTIDETNSSNTIDDSELNNSADSVSDDTCAANYTEFSLSLSEEEWNAIKPNGITKCGRRNKYFLQKGVWTNVLSIALSKQYKFPCAFTFKRADVHLDPENNIYELQIKGSCKDKLCANKIYVDGTKNVDEIGVILRVRTRDTRDIYHNPVKRPLNGQRRLEVQNELAAKGCKNWQREQARLCMVDGDIVPPFIPNDGVLRNAKKEKMNADLNVRAEDGRDIIRTVENLKLSPEFAGSIHVVASMPFSTFYSTPAQLTAYKEYHRMTRGQATIILDSTGSLVQPLQRPEGLQSGHIFLYSIVVNFENSTLPIHQMLSEAHGTDLITYWLQHWVRTGAPKPGIVVSDYSRALLAGVCTTFNNCTVKTYIETTFANADDKSHTNKPSTLIRIDVAHLTHMVCRWKCFKPVQQRCIKEFYVRCVSLMVDAKSKIEFGQIFALTCAVGLQSHEDAKIDVYGANTARDARTELESLIANRNEQIDLNVVEKTCNTRTFGNRPEEFDPRDTRQEDLSDPAHSGTLFMWLSHRKNNAERIMQAGVNLNPFYLPDFIEQIFNLAKEFPLWSCAAISNNVSHATSSYVEGYFNDLKSRVLKNISTPLRIDKFLKVHLRDICGQTLLFSSKISRINKMRLHLKVSNADKATAKVNTVNHELRQNYCTGRNVDLNTTHSDLLAYENWRGKAADGADNLDFREDLLTDSGKIHIFSSSLKQDAETSHQKCVSETLISEQSIMDHTYSIQPEFNSFQVDSEAQESAEKQAHSQFSTPISVSPAQESITEINIKPQKCSSPPPSSDCAPSEPKLKRYTSKYYESYPDIRQRNLLTTNTAKPVLLPNGSICRVPVNVDGVTSFVKYTCPFDTLIHILMVGAVDDPAYASILKESSNPTLQFVWAVINTGATKKIFEDRARLLKQLGYPCTPEAGTRNRMLSYSINAWDSMASVVNKTLRSYPSVYVTENCSGCSGRAYVRPCLIPSHRKLYEYGFGALEDALEFQPSVHNVQCSRCKGKLTIQNRPNTHILIELDISPCAKTRLSCKLKQLPTTINLRVDEKSTSTYRLIGVATFFAEHFVAHCRRTTNLWQKYNDMHPKIVRSSLKDDVEPHLAVYLEQK